METKKLVIGALLIAIAVILQSLRLFVPLPPLAGTLIIGSLVNMMLAASYLICGFKVAGMLSVLLPLSAYFQGQLLLPVLVPLVVIGNFVYIGIISLVREKKTYYIFPAIGKAAVMLSGAKMFLVLFEITGAAAKSILFAMSIPQLITGLTGAFLAKKVFNMIIVKK